MSNAEYETYQDTAGQYDETRAAIGMDVVWGALRSTGRPIASLHVIDAACGTGNYAAQVAGQVARLQCLDLSPAMLEQAKTKLAGQPDVDFAVGDATALPFEAESADAIMLNQAAHHLEAPDDAERFESLGRFVQQAQRILRPGGVLSLNTSSRRQVVDGYWWADLIPDAVAIIRRRYPPIRRIRELLEAAGFENVRCYVPLDAVLQTRNYLDPGGPLRQEWRDGDSTWSLAGADELAAAPSSVSAHSSGLAKWMPTCGRGKSCARTSDRRRLSSRTGAAMPADGGDGWVAQFASLSAARREGREEHLHQTAGWYDIEDAEVWRDYVLDAVGARLAPGQRVFEAGCGVLAFLEVLHSAQPGLSLAGVDGSAESIELVHREVAPRLGIDPDAFRVGRLPQALLQEAPEQYELTVCNSVLQYLSNEHAWQVIESLWNMTRPGGALVLADLCDSAYRENGRREARGVLEGLRHGAAELHVFWRRRLREVSGHRGHRRSPAQHGGGLPTRSHALHRDPRKAEVTRPVTSMARRLTSMARRTRP